MTTAGMNDASRSTHWLLPGNRQKRSSTSNSALNNMYVSKLPYTVKRVSFKMIVLRSLYVRYDVNIQYLEIPSSNNNNNNHNKQRKLACYDKIISVICFHKINRCKISVTNFTYTGGVIKVYYQYDSKIIFILFFTTEYIHFMAPQPPHCSYSC